MDYKPLDVKSFDELAEKDFEQIDPLIDHFLPGVGVFLFCGSSKIGKSWLALDIGIHLGSGEKFWGYDVRQTEVLYLCLEDGERRLQDRMLSIADEYRKSVHYCTEAMTIDTNLIQQLEEQLTVYPGIGLIIIDTLAAVRGELTAYHNNAYLADYGVIRSLHDFSLKNNITILVIHHVRKMKSSDPFDDISGTNGLFGSADGAFIFLKEDDSDDIVKLHSRCRDMEDRVLTIRFNSTTCRWELVDEGAPWEDAFKTDPDLKKVIEHVKEQGMFIGLASELCELLQLSKKPQSISGKLYNRRGQLKKMGILFGRTRTREGSMLTLFTEANPAVKKDACDDVCRSDDFSSPTICLMRSSRMTVTTLILGAIISSHRHSRHNNRLERRGNHGQTI